MNTKSQITIAQALAQALARTGVRQIFGLPGGGSSLDLIEAAAEVGIGFTLTKTENAAVMMAGALAETTGVPGVALMTKGPGVANATNGVAYAKLDRAPVLVITDGFTDKQLTYITHQVFDQKALLQPVVKGVTRLESATPAAEIKAIIALACQAPLGPVHIELTGEVARRLIDPPQFAMPASATSALDYVALQNLTEQLKLSKKPVLIVGLEARHCAAEVRQLAAQLKCPVLQTYKAKGVISDLDPQVVGIFTGGIQEADCLAQADLMVLVGLDPVEMILQPWPYNKPAVELSNALHDIHYIKPLARVGSALKQHVFALNEQLSGYVSSWSLERITLLRQDILKRLAYPPVQFGVAPDRLVQLSAQVYAEQKFRPRMSVDAGAHMFSATAFFPVTQPGDVLISNGLATMAFALPAAIAAALDEPAQPVICFTGDGGLMMCLGELCTAIDTGASIVVVVFNDSSLSLIDIKQQSKQLPSRGVRWGKHNFAQAMQALGGQGFEATTEVQYQQALTQALKLQSPSLIDVQIDPSGYSQQLKAMRG
ncbi:MAG: thiamine pyrophosphate-dependent enzyme [Alcaligenaceae bacterium]